MTMTIPSTQGQAGEDLNGMPVHRLPLVSTAASRHARSWGTRPGHERPPGHAALRALPRRGQVRGLLLVVRRQHGRRARRGGSGTGRAPPARGQDAQSLRYVSGRAICARGWEQPCAGAGMLRAAPARLCCRWGGTEGAAARGAGVATAQRDGPEGRTDASPPFRRHEAACAHLPTAAKPLRVPRAPEF